MVYGKHRLHKPCQHGMAVWIVFLFFYFDLRFVFAVRQMEVKWQMVSGTEIDDTIICVPHKLTDIIRN